MRRVREAIKRLHALNERIDHLRGLRMQLTQYLNDMPRAHKVTSTLEELTVQILDLSDEAERLEQSLPTLKVEVLEKIMAMTTAADERRVLMLRYVSGCTFKEASERLGYSLRHVYRIDKKYNVT